MSNPKRLLKAARSRAFLYSMALLTLGAPGIKADDLAYVGSSTGQFGTIDLNTGAFTSSGNSGQTLAGLAVANGSIFATSYHTANGTLFTVNPANGALTSIGTVTGLNYDDFGSTTSGLYAVSFGTTQNLYSINPATGAATLIGPTGLGYGAWRALSNNSSVLYFADGPNLYTLNTSTGAATLVGAFGGSAQIGALLTEGGVLYGGDDVNNRIDTINPITGAATLGSAPSGGFSGSFYGLAPNPVPTPTTVPEPSTCVLAGVALTSIVLLRRRTRA